MTAPHIGNTGINDEDDESRRIWVAGYVIRDPPGVCLQLALPPGSRRGTRRPGRRRDQRGGHPCHHPAPAGPWSHAGWCLLRPRRRPPEADLLAEVLATPSMVGSDLCGGHHPRVPTWSRDRERRFTVQPSTWASRR
jgi:hypothetical protein